MQKPVVWLPFIFVYKLVFIIIRIPVNIIKYFSLGTLFTINFILELVIYNIKGLIWASYFMYDGFKHFIKGILTCLFVLVSPFKNIKKKPKIVKIKEEKIKPVKEVKTKPIKEVKVKEEKVHALKTKEEVITVKPELSDLIVTDKELQLLIKAKLKIQNNIRKEEIRKQKQDFAEEKHRKAEEAKSLQIERKKELDKKNKDVYINSEVDIKQPGITEKLKALLNSLKTIPEKISKSFYNNEFIKHNRNQKTIQREALLINFEGEDAEKSDIKILFEYVAKDKDGKVIKGYFEAFSKVEVHSYLLSEGYEVYSIKTNKWIKLFHGKSNINHTKVKNRDLIFFLTQLSTYLKAGIPLVESLKILARQFKNKAYKKIFDALVYDLTTGENFSEALLKQNVAFPRLLINMVKTSEMTGELPEVLDDMADYYSETEKTRKQMITALMYPSLVFVFSVAVITFIMLFVIPQFVKIYETMDASQIPAFTLFVMATSEFLKKYLIVLLVGICAFIVLFIYMYNNMKLFRTICQWLLMHIPVIGTSVIYNEVTMFTKTFASLLSHNVFITDSMEVLNKITNNEIYKMLILDTITNLAKGDKISKAFEGNWAFPVPAYEMLVTGEKTGELAEMMGKVADYYQGLHKESVTRIKTFIEPILTIFLTAIVGVIILSIIIPMFSMYGTIQSAG